MKKHWLLVPLVSMLVTACGGTSIGKIDEIIYEDNILTFSELSNVDGYHFTFKEGDEILYEELTYTSNMIDCSILGLEGSLLFSVCGRKGDKDGPITSLEIEIPSYFEDVVFEAEDYLYNFGSGKSTSNFRDNPLASNNAYVGGIDDCGQGIYINYCSPVAGTFEFESHYIAIAPAINGVWVNGVKQTTFNYNELSSNWAGTGVFDVKVATVSITLQEGWNTISIMKEGDASNNWGEFAELDYFVLKGNGQQYNKSEIVAKHGVRPEKLRLEAEMGSPRKKISDVYQCKNPCIVNDATYQYSNGYLMGGIEARYDGVEWQMFLEEETTFEVTVGYATGQANAVANFFVVPEVEVGLAKGADFLDMEKKVVNLPQTGWNVVQEAEEKIQLTLPAGKSFIYCIKLETVSSGDNAKIFQLDYIDLRVVE